MKIPRLLTGAAITLLAIDLLPVSAREVQVLHGHVPDAITQLSLQPIDRLSVTNRLDLVIGLPLRNRDVLTNLFQQIYDQTSTNYHHYLTPEEFTRKFGPTEWDYQALIDFAKTNGLVVTGTHSNHTLLDVEASVADIEKVFHVTMRVYQHPIEDRTFFAPSSEPSLDLSVPVLHITGLDNYVVPHPNLVITPTNNVANAVPNIGSGVGGSYQGSDFRRAYAPGVSLTGSGQVVGLLELDGYNSSDITAYSNAARVPTVPLQNVLLDGFSGSAGSANSEVCLDIEMTMSMAPGLSKVIVYEAPQGWPYLGNSYWVDILNEMAYPSQGEPLPMQLSSSWTLGDNSSADQLYEEFALQGQSFFQSSGDYGAYYSGLFGISGLGGIPQWADTPYVTIVGGTLLTTDISGNWSSETTWNQGYDLTVGHYLASGGGISQNYPIPSWQQGISMSANQGSTTMRNVPDVSMVAENILISYNNGSWGTSGGTSASTPLWAAFMALINQQSVANGGPVNGFLNVALYSIGKGGNYSSAFHDVADNSTNGNGHSEYYAVSGYDLCTGLGTPKGLNLINLLAPSPPPIVVSVSPSSITGLPLPQTQRIQILGSGFTSSSTLILNDGVNSYNSDATRLTFVNSHELDYLIAVGVNPATWTVEVVNANQTSNLGIFTVVSPSSAINLSCYVSPGTVSPNSPYTVSGTASYNNGSGGVVAGTATILCNGQLYTTPIVNGSYSRQIAAPPSAGNYQVSVTATDGNGQTGSNSASLVVSSNGMTSGYTIGNFLTCTNADSASPYNFYGQTSAFGSDDSKFVAWLELDNITGEHSVEFRLYRPDGTYYGNATGTAGVVGNTYSWWRIWASWPVTGYDIPYTPGIWDIKLYVDGIYEQSISLTMRYQFTEHQMAKGVQSTSPYNPIQPSNIFYQTDQKAVVWLNLDTVSDPINVKWVFYEPNGTEYLETTTSSPSPDASGYDYWYSYRFWGWINITGNNAANKCGNWKVDVFIKDPSGNWVKQYTDYFQIIESPPQPPACSVSLTPVNPVIGQTLTFNVYATDNTYLQSIHLYWNDGSAHSYSWNNIITSSFNQSFIVGSYPSKQQITYWVVATDTSGNTTESIHNSVVIVPPLFNITASAGNGGGITPGGSLTENAGAFQNFTAIPNSNYAVNLWLLDGSVAQTSGFSYTLNDIQTNHIVQVTFTYIPPPSFSGFKVSGDKLQMTLSGLSPGETVVFETSSDLKNWAAVQTNGVSSSTLTITNLINSAMVSRFFRARLQ